MKKLDLQLQICLGILTTKIYAKNNYVSINEYLMAASNWKGQNDFGAFPFYIEMWREGLQPSKDAWLVKAKDLGFDSEFILCFYTKEHLYLPHNAKILNSYKILASDKQWSSCEDYIEQNKAFITYEAYKNYCNNIDKLSN